MIEIIFESDFKKMFAHKIWLILGLMIALLFYGGMRFDILGYDRYIPKERRIDRAYVYTDTFGNVSDLNADFELTGKEGSRYARIVPETSEEVFSESAFPVETVRKIAEKGAEDTVNLKNNQMDSGSIGDACFRDVLVSWKLDNGRRIFRKYSMDLSSVKEELDAIHDSEEFRKAAYPVLLQKPEEIVSINYRNFGGIETIKGMSKEQTARLLYAYQSELSALTADTRRQESPVAAVQFQTKKMKDAIDCLLTDNIYYMPFNDYFYYPVYPSFTKTISVLSEAGVILNEALLPENIERISLSQMKIADETTGDLIITDPEQIKQVLSAIVPTNLPCDNRYLPVYYGIAISTELYKEPAAGRDGYMNYVFDAAKIPDFVKEHFRLTEEEISRDSEKSY